MANTITYTQFCGRGRKLFKAAYPNRKEVDALQALRRAVATSKAFYRKHKINPDFREEVIYELATHAFDDLDITWDHITRALDGCYSPAAELARGAVAGRRPITWYLPSDMALSIITALPSQESKRFLKSLLNLCAGRDI